jgi:hypothetical protein
LFCRLPLHPFSQEVHLPLGWHTGQWHSQTSVFIHCPEMRKILFKEGVLSALKAPLRWLFWHWFHWCTCRLIAHILRNTIQFRKILWIWILNKMCHETQMPPYEANSRGGHHRQNPRSRCQNLRFQYKGLVSMNIHMKYKSPISYHLERYGQC